VARRTSGEERLMRLRRTHAVVLVAVAVWNVVTYAQFTKVLVTTNDRPAGYYVAHTVLIVVNLVIAAVLGTWGVKALRAPAED
jgi:Mg2+/Co2+ transporter CorB